MKFPSARWLVLTVFLLGYLASRDIEWDAPGGDWLFLILTVLSVAACALLLTRLHGPATETLWAWVVLAVLLDGCFVKLYWIASNLQDAEFLVRYYPELVWLNNSQLLDGYGWM